MMATHQTKKAGRNRGRKKTGLHSQYGLSYREDQAGDKTVNDLFEKRFSIVENQRYSLPPPERLFQEAPWRVEALQNLKDQLNEVKNRLNNYNHKEWASHTKMRNRAKDVMWRVRRDIQPEFVTQAWCKFYEIVSSFPLVPLDLIRSRDNYFKSVHLCEAPGAFVASLNHWLRTNVPDVRWDWTATTLNPYYEGNPLSLMNNCDRFMRYTLSHWCFGEDNTGDLMNLENLVELVKAAGPLDKVLLVTADGSIDCMEVPAEQETLVARLNFCETLAAMHLLAKGGSFLLKVFTVFEHHTICLMYLLSCCFEKVDAVKPATSKEGNSEMYVVCRNFKGLTFVRTYLKTLRNYYGRECTKAMFHKDDIPPGFLEDMIKCSEFFKTQQCLVITKNIETFESESNADVLYELKQTQHMVAETFLKRYNLKKLICGAIVGKDVLESCNDIKMSKRIYMDSYNERCKKQHSAPLERLKELYRDTNQIKTYIPTNQSIAFEILTWPKELQIRLGKVFDKVYSSRFCTTDVMRLQNSVDSIISSTGHKISFPSKKSIREVEDELSSDPSCSQNQVILTFKCTSHNKKLKTTGELHSALECLNPGWNLVLIAYPLLTHFHVGLLYLIGCSFSTLKVQLHDTVGSIITLENYDKKSEILRHIDSVKTECSTAKAHCKTVLEVLPASLLYDTDLYSTIVDVNHWVIKLSVQHAVQKLDKSATDEENDM